MFTKFLSTLTLIFISGILPVNAFAQDVYTVRAGVFRDVKSNDFKEIKDLGYVHSLPAGDKEVEVYVGQFSDQNKAAQVATALYQRGFVNNKVFTIPSNAGESLIVIQFALHKVNGAIPWKAYDELGELYAQSLDGTLKIFRGPFATTEAAKAALPAIKAAGYGDAFVKSVSSMRLIPIDIFETGLKKPMFKIVYPPKVGSTGSTIEPAPATTPTSEPGATPISSPAGATVPAPAAYEAPKGIPVPNDAVKPAPTPTQGEVNETVVLTPPAAAAPPTLPAATSDIIRPAFDPAQKQAGTIELQKTLQQQGYYKGSIAGLYGPGTTVAFKKAWKEMPEVRKYRLLSGASFAPVDSDRGAVVQWPEVAVLLAIVEDLAAGQADVQRGRTLAGQRAALFNAQEELNPVAVARTKDWSNTLWTNLTDWETEDPLHAQIMRAMRVSYFQTQALLEQHYTNAGFAPKDANDLSIAMMQNLTGAQLSRFL